MPERYGMSRATEVALTDDWVWTLVGAIDTDPRSEDVPARARLEAVEVALSTLAGGPASMTVSLARASSGYPRMTPGNTSGAEVDLEADPDDATQASASQLLDRAYVRQAEDGGVAIGLKLDAGTASGNITLTWSRW